MRSKVWLNSLQHLQHWGRVIIDDLASILGAAACDFCAKPINVEVAAPFHPRICHACLESLHAHKLDYHKHRHKNPKAFMAKTPYLCQKCSHPVVKPTKCCWVCKRNPLKTDKLVSLFFNAGLPQTLIYQYKFDHHRSYIPLLTSMILERAGKYLKEFDVCVPITLNQQEIRRRDFCQVMAVMKPVMQTLAIPIVPALARHKHNKAQHTQNLRERRATTKERFFLVPEYRGTLGGKRVLVVDDIYTTGATINVAAEYLASANRLRSIGAFTFLRSVLERSKGAGDQRERVFTLRENVPSAVMEQHWTYFT